MLIKIIALLVIAVNAHEKFEKFLFDKEDKKKFREPLSWEHQSYDPNRNDYSDESE